MKLSDYIGRYWASAEVMYAVIIAMTFTSTLRGHDDMYEMLYQTIVYSALFCCIAWGVADGLFYAWERRHIIKTEILNNKFPIYVERTVLTSICIQSHYNEIPIINLRQYSSSNQ